VEEDCPRARRGRVVPIQLVGPHQWQRASKCSVAHCGRPRATTQQGRLRLANIKVRTGRVNSVKTPSTVHQVGGSSSTSPPKRRRNDGAVLCSALLCSGTPPALCIRIARNSSQLQNSKTFVLFDRTLVCVSPHAPRPMLVEQGTLSWLMHCMQAVCA
jgi:hypothetical protein